MDFLYAGVLLFFALYLLLYLNDKRKRIKEIEKFNVPSSYDLSLLYGTYGIMLIILGFILYFLFR